MKNKIHIILGTRAQLIKMAPVMRLLQEKKIPYNFIFTGQHKETIEELEKDFGIKNPDIILHTGKDITGIFQSMFWLTKMIFINIFEKRKIFGEVKKNDILLTHGDTFSTLVGAIMGKLAKIKVAHIESGLRSFNIFHPFPEEINRILTSKLSNYYFCPGSRPLKNLKKYKGKKINTQSNTLKDSLDLALKKSARLMNIKEKYCICSIHRFENIFKKKRLKMILNAISDISKKYKIIFILHPPTKKQLEKWQLIETIKNNKNIELKNRLNYSDFIKLLQKSEFIITDGGSNQEEAFYLGKPCLIMRKTTERQEGLDRNAVISEYNSEIISKFVESYAKYRKKPFKNIKSPSEIIIQNILKNDQKHRTVL